MTGIFLAVEGPNGVGKSTVVAELASKLRGHGEWSVHTTTEPSDLPLGRLLRSSEAVIAGRALALAIAADRYVHLDTEIMPLLADGHLVISDRYVQSSLVLQRIDGMTLAEIWNYNAHVIPPTVTFYLEDEPAVIGDRLGARTKLSRLELAGSPGYELELYAEAFDFLRQHGWEQVKIDCHGKTPSRIVADILERLGPHLTQST